MKSPVIVIWKPVGGNAVSQDLAEIVISAPVWEYRILKKHGCLA
jgi:hypothetical protein